MFTRNDFLVRLKHTEALKGTRNPPVNIQALFTK